MGKYNIAAVVAEFNFDINQMMLGLAKEEAKSRGSEITKVFIAPGVFDMALPIKKLLATDHDQIVAQHAARKITDLSLEYDKPVTLGISGPGMTRLDAHKRIDMGKKAVEAAIKILDRMEEIG